MKKYILGLSVVFVVLFAAVTYGQELERWILVTDPHIPTNEKQGLNSRNVIGNFKTMTKEVLALDPKPTGVIITGDIANHRGVESDYLMAKRLFQPFETAKLPLYPLLGNHDRRDPFFSVFPKWKAKSAVPGRHCFELKTKYVDFYMLDSNNSGESTGELGEAQMTWLEQAMCQPSDKPAVVFLHHDITSLTEKDRIVALAKKCPRFKAYIFGHIHDPKFCTPTKARPFYYATLLAISAGPNSTAPYGWNDCTIGPNEMVITLRTGEPQQEINGTVWRIPLK